MENIELEQNFLKVHKEISVWLENIFSSQPVPEYEIKKKTTNSLYKLMKRNQELDRLTKINIDDISRKTQEYSIEDTYIQQVLEDIGLSHFSLSQSGVSCLRTLSEVAIQLRLKNCNLSSYLMAMSDLSGKIEEKRTKLRKEQAEKQQLQSKLQNLSHEKESLARCFEAFEQQAVVQRPLREKRSKETQFLKGKAKEYNSLIENLQETINQTGLSDDLHHETLEQLSEELNEVRGQIMLLKTRLSSFHSLPPDMSLARVKIEEAKQELERLEKELYMDLEILNL